MKKRLYTFLATLIASSLMLHANTLPAFADRLVPEFDYIQETADGKFVFVMLAIDDDPLYNLGTTVQSEVIRRKYFHSGLYRNDGSKRPIWTVDWYAFEVDISSNGRFLVRRGFWPSSDNYDELALAFYRDGYEMKRYEISQLVAKPESLPHTESHYMWLKDALFDDKQNVLQIETHNGEKYAFNITTGTIIEGNPPVSKSVVFTGYAIGGLLAIYMVYNVLYSKKRRRNQKESNNL